jgi:DNA-binding NarL/FixJ family response regulator
MSYHFLTVSTRLALHDGLRAWLLDHSLAATIDVANSGAEALGHVDEMRPDVIVVDDPMTDMSARQFAATVRERNASAQVVIIGDVSGAAIRLDFDAGIGGFVSAQAEPHVLLAAVSAVLDGRTYVDPTLAGELFTAHGTDCPSPRELQILDLIVAGHQNKVIAHMLGIGQETVKTHISTLMRKLGVRSRTELAVKALQQSFVRLPALA